MEVVAVVIFHKCCSFCCPVNDWYEILAIQRIPCPKLLFFHFWKGFPWKKMIWFTGSNAFLGFGFIWNKLMKNWLLLTNVGEQMINKGKIKETRKTAQYYIRHAKNHYRHQGCHHYLKEKRMLLQQSANLISSVPLYSGRNMIQETPRSDRWHVR